MESNIKGLVSAGHEMASELKAECGAVDMRSVAKLISDLATQLEVQLVRANALAAENAGLKKFCKDAAFDADYEAELGMERGGFSDALNEIKTPATDAFWLKYVRRAWRCLLTICCAQTLMTLSVTLLPIFAKEATSERD